MNVRLAATADLETESHNHRARELYQRAGFVADDSIWMSHDFTELD